MPKPDNKKIALERIRRLFAQAEEAFREDPEKAHRHVAMARKIALRYNVRLPVELKRRVCKGCGRFLVPGKNARTRLSPRKASVITTCLECGHVSRHPYRKEKRKAKKPQ